MKNAGQPLKEAAVGWKDWSASDHSNHQWAQGLTTMERLKVLAEWGGLTVDYYRLDPGERRDRLIEIRFARDQRIIGWIEDCPEPTHLAPRGRKSQGR